MLTRDKKNSFNRCTCVDVVVD